MWTRGGGGGDGWMGCEVIAPTGAKYQGSRTLEGDLVGWVIGTTRVPDQVVQSKASST